MRSNRTIVAALLLTLWGCTRAGGGADTTSTSATTAQATAHATGEAPATIDSPRVVQVSNAMPGAGTTTAARDTAMFAGGCFWSMERPFQHVPGVLATTVGYAGGHTRNPTYEQVNTRSTGHTETVLVEYNPAVVSYEKLLDVYWHNIDPVTKDRQFCDRGPDYRTVVFTHGSGQHAAALASKAALDRSGHFSQPIVTEIVADVPFWRGEEYHQHYADRNPGAYDAYRRGCGRDERLHELWGAAAAPFVPAP
jgi:peptide-methionine (S)-S-oxide reductase